MKLVTDVADLTPGWFTDVLGGGGDAAVVAVDVEPMNIGAMCRMVRAVLTWGTDRGGPASVVVKFPTADASTLGLAQAMGMYELEVRSYRDLLPRLSGVRAPACHLAELDDATGAFTLVLEDLTAGTRPGDVLTESPRDECEAVLTQLGRLQAGSWDAPELQTLRWLADPQRTVQVFDLMPAGLSPFLERFGDRLEPRHVALFEQVIPQAGRWIRSWGAPTVVQHGDLRADNVLFAPGDPVTATIVDFQTVRLGPPGIDPAYFLGSSLSTTTRREVETDLLGSFHDTLCAGGVEGWTFDACFEAYRHGALYAVYLFCGLSVRVAPSERIDRVIADQTRRYADMALDLESVEAAGLTV